MDVDMQQQRQQQRRDASSDLVVRDKNGDAEVANPPALVVDDEDELQALEMQEENESERVPFTLYGILFLSTFALRIDHDG